MKKEICHNYRKRMFKNRTESAKKYKEYLVWLKASRIKTAKIQKEYECIVKALADEITRCHKEYLAKYVEEEKKIRKRQFSLKNK
jgi:restriction endonuclease